MRREEVFVTTKVACPADLQPQWPPFYTDFETEYLTDLSLSAYDGLLAEFFSSLSRLGLGYVDCLLVHWPGHPANTLGPAAANKRREMWAAMEYIYQLGLARSIGVSNWSEDHLREIFKVCSERPHLNQLENHPALQQQALVRFCQSEGVAVSAYSPIAGTDLSEPTLLDIASAHDVTAEAVVYRWLQQRGLSVLTKSTKPERAAANLAAAAGGWELSPEEMAAMAGLERDGRREIDPHDIQ